MDIDIPPVEAHTDLSISLNSVVEVTLGKGNSYGIIRWIGMLPGREDKMVGLELVNLFADVLMFRLYCEQDL